MAAADDTRNCVNFTPGRISAFACSGASTEATLWDAKVPGLGLRARRAGSAVYIFHGRLKGRRIKVRIGSPKNWDIEQARAEARRLRVLIDSGIDPRKERAERDRANEAARRDWARAAATLATVWPEYLKANRARWSSNHYHDHEKAIQSPGQPSKIAGKTTAAGPLHALAHLRLGELTPEVLQRWVETESQTRATVTARAFRLLRAFLNWCDGDQRYSGVVTPAVLTKQVRRAVQAPRVRDDVLQREMLAPWFQAVEQNHNPVMPAYFIALLLTGARKEEMAGLRWADVDFRWCSIRISDKVEGERVIPLTPYLAQRLNALPRRNEWIFSSTASGNGRIIRPHGAHARALHLAGLPHVTLHGLRRSFGTLAEWVECPAGVVAQLMGHKPSAIAEKHYRRRPIDLLRQWHIKIEAWILEQAGIEVPAEGEMRGLRVVQGGGN